MKVIDLLNKIAKGEIKAGAKFKYKKHILIYNNNYLNIEGAGLYCFNNRNLNDEIEIMQKTKGRWKPVYLEKYYYIDNGNISYTCWDNWDIDRTRYAIGNCFKTKEQAEFAKQQAIYIQQYKDYLQEHEEEAINWEDIGKPKYCACYDFENQKNNICISYYCKKQGIIYTSRRESIQEFIDLIGEDNFKKYILEVE